MDTGESRAPARADSTDFGFGIFSIEKPIDKLLFLLIIYNSTMSLEPGDLVTLHVHNNDRPALVTAVHDQDGNTDVDPSTPSLNLASVNKEDSRTDRYGRVVDYFTSVPHKDSPNYRPDPQNPCWS